MATWVNCIQAHVLWLINVNRDSKNWVRVNMMISWEADADETNKYAFNKPSLHLYRSCDHTTSPLVTPYKTKETCFQSLCYFLQWWNFIVFEEKKKSNSIEHLQFKDTQADSIYWGEFAIIPGQLLMDHVVRLI